MDRNRLGHRLDDKPYRLRGRNGRAACHAGSGRLDPAGALANRRAALIAGSVASIRNVL